MIWRLWVRFPPIGRSFYLFLPRRKPIKRAELITLDMTTGKTVVLAEKLWQATVKREVVGTDDEGYAVHTSRGKLGGKHSAIRLLIVNSCLIPVRQQ